jgi:hypothetical protein
LQITLSLARYDGIEKVVEVPAIVVAVGRSLLDLSDLRVHHTKL